MGQKRKFGVEKVSEFAPTSPTPPTFRPYHYETFEISSKIIVRSIVDHGQENWNFATVRGGQ